MVRQVPLVPRWVRWLVVLVAASGIFVASTVRPGSGGPVAGPFGVVGLDKYVHALGYAVLASVLVYALAEWDPGRTVVAVLLIVPTFGLVVELVQLPLAYRQFTRLDLVANAAGASIVALFWHVVAPRVRFHPLAVTRVNEPTDTDS